MTRECANKGRKEEEDCKLVNNTAFQMFKMTVNITPPQGTFKATL